MDREQIKEKIFNRYIKPIQKKRKNYIGIEIEMPLINLEAKGADQKLAQKTFDKFVKKFGFKPEKFDDNGICYSATHLENGDNISFDCSYNNLELSLGKQENLNDINETFKEYVTFLNDELLKENHMISGFGVNPFIKENKRGYIPSERYRMLEGYLAKADEWNYPMYFHPYVGYGTYSSASQVQLDFNEDEIIDVLKAYSLVEPLKALLFSNSILPAEPELKCVRDLFWKNSTHGINPHNIGMFETEIDSIDELVNYISSCSLFNVSRDGRSIFFKPLTVYDFLNKEEIIGEVFEDGEFKETKFKPEVNDLEFLRTYKFEDLTFRGTVEFRSCCNQPLSEAMTVAAFHLGLKRKVPELLELLNNDKVIYKKGYTASELRDLMNQREIPQFINKDDLKELLINVLDLASEGLKERNMGEEKFLDPLYLRARNLTSPADYLINSDEKDLIQIIKDFGDFNNLNPLKLN